MQSIPTAYVAIYFLALSALSFVLHTVDYFMFQRYVNENDRKIKREKPIRGYGLNEDFLALISFIGGALGTCIAYIVWERRINAANVGQRLWAFLLLVVQVIVFLCLAGPDWMRVDLVGEASALASRFPFAVAYLSAINVATFVAFFIDKRLAINKRRRIPESVLLGMCLVGGTLGGYFAVVFLVHKVNKHEFYVGIPMIAIVQAIVVAYLKAIGVL